MGKCSFSQKSTLDFYIQQALGNSPLMKDYQNQIQSNLVDSLRIKATYKPQVTGNSSDSYFPVINGFGYDGVITNGSQVSALVTVNQTLVSKKNLSAQFQNLRLQNEGITNNAKISEQDLIRTITAQYLTTYGTLQQLNLAKEVNELLKKEVDVLKTLTEHNVYRQTDYLTLLVTVQQQELSMKQLAIQFRNDYATLNYLSGIIDTAAVPLQEPSLIIRALPDPDNSVFFQKYTLDSLQLAHNRVLIDFNYKPKLDLYANGGYLSSFAYRAYKNFGTGFGLDLTVPIYDGKQRKLQYSKLDIAERTRKSYKSFYQNQYYQQVAQLKQQLQATESLIGDINNQIKYSEGLIQVNAKLLTTGDAKIADMVIALDNYLAAKNLLTQNKISRLQIINQINYWNR
jgi:outer membrane protein TolC